MKPSMQTLKDFKGIESCNFFEQDKGFHELLHFLKGASEADRLSSILRNWGTKLKGWNELANEAARPEKLPRVEKYDRVGNRIEEIVLPLETRTFRKEVVESGIFESQNEIEKFSKIYLLAHLGEAGVTCPLACTDGLIRVLEAQGSDFLKQTWLPLLKSSQTPLAGAQFITEQSGGSDVGAIEGVAKPNADGSFSLSAEKWYCSATDEFFLVAARPEGAPEGTKGLAIFFVPRTLEENGIKRVNQLSIRRLKNKLGTQSLPTAEIDFEGSKAFLIGEAHKGFHHLMTYVLNASRMHNSANCLGLVRRAFLEARNYANQRVAFGKEIIQYPLVQESLLSLQATLYAKRALFFWMLKKIDQNGFIAQDPEENFWQRCLVNLMKYRTAIITTDQVKNAILVMGANGIIEDFSILPRLLRDSLIVETWEGAHNILCLQILRDGLRFNLVKKIEEEVENTLGLWPSGSLTQSRLLYEKAFGLFKQFVQEEKLQDNSWIQTHAKRVVDLFGSLLETGFLIRQGLQTQKQNLLAMASYLIHQEFSLDLGHFHNPVLNHLGDIALPLIQEDEAGFPASKNIPMEKW